MIIYQFIMIVLSKMTIDCIRIPSIWACFTNQRCHSCGCVFRFLTHTSGYFHIGVAPLEKMCSGEIKLSFKDIPIEINLVFKYYFKSSD